MNTPTPISPVPGRRPIAPTATRRRRRVVAIAGSLGAALALAAPAAATAAAPPEPSWLAQTCRRSGGTIEHDASIRPTCRDARLTNPWFEESATYCRTIGGEFIVEAEDGYKVGDWVCDVSAL
jgi:hypothetical protein